MIYLREKGIKTSLQLEKIPDRFIGHNSCTYSYRSVCKLVRSPRLECRSELANAAE